MDSVRKLEAIAPVDGSSCSEIWQELGDQLLRVCDLVLGRTAQDRFSFQIFLLVR